MTIDAQIVRLLLPGCRPVLLSTGQPGRLRLAGVDAAGQVHPLPFTRDVDAANLSTWSQTQSSALSR